MHIWDKLAKKVVKAGTLQLKDTLSGTRIGNICRDMCQAESSGTRSVIDELDDLQDYEENILQMKTLVCGDVNKCTAWCDCDVP